MAKGGFDINGSVLIHCYGELTEAIIPEGITEIADGAFSCNAHLKKVVIPSTVTKIGARAFGWCENLVEINIPDSVISIGERAFIDCGYMKEIKLGKNVEELGACAFWLCSNLNEVILSPKLKRIKHMTFLDCIRLKSVEMGGEVKVIEEGAFKNTSISFITLSETLEEIGNYAFENSRLIRLEIPASVKKVGHKIAAGCIWLQIFECYPTAKPEGWDEGWSYIDEINKPFIVWDCLNTNGVVGKYNKEQLSIDGSVLTYCQSDAKKVRIPDGVTTVKEGAFRDCTNIETLSVPNSVYRFCDGVFNSNCHIRWLEYRGTIKEWCEIGFYDCESNPLSFAGGFIVGGEPVNELVIPDGVKEIGNYAFQNLSITRLVLPEGLKRIGKDAFRSTLISELVLPESLEEIGDYAFWGCGNIGNVVFPDKLKSIGSGAFICCFNMLKITLSRKTRVEEDTFEEMPNGFEELEIIYKD